MGWWGKIICGGIGVAVGGPIGAAVGGTLGHYLWDNDKDDVEGYVEDCDVEGYVDDNDRNQVVYFASFFSCLGKMAKADGRVSSQEIQSVEDLIAEIGMDKEERMAAIAIFTYAKSDEHYDARDFIVQFAETVGYDDELCSMLLSSLAGVAAADGKLDSCETAILREAGTVLRVPDSIIDALLSSLTDQCHSLGDELATSYALLDCSPEVTDSEIKHAYREKCLAFHPDRIQSKGLPPEFIEFANSQVAAINNAYETIRQDRGMT